MSDLDIGKLRGMKYAEIKELARTMNIRANVKSDILINAILSHIKLQASPSPMKRLRKSARKSSMKIEKLAASTPKNTPPSTKRKSTPKRRRTYEVSPENSFLVAVNNTPTTTTTDEHIQAEENDEAELPMAVDASPRTPLPNTIKERLRRNIAQCKSAAVQTTPNTVAKQDKVVPKRNVPAKDKSAIPRPVAISRPILSKVAATPNFKAIHNRAFDKLESIDVTWARRNVKLNDLRAGRDNVKSIRTFGGVARPKEPKKERIMTRSKVMPKGSVFRPTIFKLADTNFEFAVQNPAFAINTAKTPRRNPLPTTSTNVGRTPFRVKVPENVPTNAASKRLPFNLQESLNRKLGYVPHYGPIQPVKPISNAEDAPAGEEKRIQNREVLKGVRRNKRFELQLKSRGINA